MGLDTYAAKKVDGKIELQEDGFEGIDHLVGGLFSGNGDDGSFRGKVYAGIVSNVTGESLYQQFIEPEAVARMHESLAGWLENHEHDFRLTPDHIGRIVCSNCGMDAEEAEDLVKFFLVCIQRGYGLHGWW